MLATSGQIDVLVNNAGISDSGPFKPELPLEFFRQVMETNFFGAVRRIKAVLPGMTERRAGTIINVTSISGRVAIPRRVLTRRRNGHWRDQPNVSPRS